MASKVEGELSGTEVFEDLGEALEAASDRRVVALLLYCRADDLEVERTLIAGVEQHGEKWLQWDVAVADHRSATRHGGPHLEIADLHQGEHPEIGPHRLLEAPLVPAAVEVEHGGHRLRRAPRRRHRDR